MLKKFLAPIIIVFFSINIKAQSKTRIESVSLLLPQYSDYNISELNNFLNNKGYQQYKEMPFSCGLQISGKANKFFFTVTESDSYRKNNYNDTSIKSSRHKISFDLGYSISPGGKFYFMPFIGVGHIKYGYKYLDKTDISLNSFMDNQNELKKLAYKREYLQIGTSIEFGNNYFVGIKTAYMQPISKGRWFIDKHQLKDNSLEILDKLYAGFYIGFRTEKPKPIK